MKTSVIEITPFSFDARKIWLWKAIQHIYRSTFDTVALSLLSDMKRKTEISVVV